MDSVHFMDEFSIYRHPCDFKRPNMRDIESRTYNTKSPYALFTAAERKAWHSTFHDLSSNCANAEDTKRRYMLLLNMISRDPVTIDGSGLVIGLIGLMNHS
jgi:hypothetical protein